ncbi:MAG: hypothetical protein ACWGOX_11630 [Desulforhopalus sp.]
MKKVLSLLALLTLVVSMAVSPVFAGGGKNQNEIGAESAPGPGDDAQGNQVGGE